MTELHAEETMLHWIESEDELGFPTWLRYVECGHWGLILTAVLPRWIYYPWRKDYPPS